MGGQRCRDAAVALGRGRKVPGLWSRSLCCGVERFMCLQSLSWEEIKNESLKRSGETGGRSLLLFRKLRS